MVDDARAKGERKRESPGEAEGMEERQYSQNTIAAPQRKGLSQLLQIGADVVMREHHTLGIAGTAAGKNDRREAIQVYCLLTAQRLFDQPDGKSPAHQKRLDHLSGSGFAGKVLQKDRAPGNLDIHAFKKRF